MCRWIVFMGKNPLLLEDLLIDPEHSIVKQVHERFRPGLFYGMDPDSADVKEVLAWSKMLFNVHGFGVAWYTDTLSKFDSSVTGMQPALFRTIAPISTDLAFQQICRHTASNCILAHVRAASFPPVVEINNHPFIYGDITFQHNGGIADWEMIRFDVLQKIKDLQDIVQTHPSSIKSSVPNGNYIFAIEGNADTEHLATLFVAYLDVIRAALEVARSSIDSFGTTTMLMAIIVTMNDIHRIQEARKVGRYKPGDNGRNGNQLNLCIVDSGSELLVTRWRDAPEGLPPSLYISFTAGEKLNRKYEAGSEKPAPDHDLYSDEDIQIQSAEELVDKYRGQETSPQGLHLIVGSEPCTREKDDWGLFGANQCLTLDKEGNFDMMPMKKLFDNEQVDAARHLLENMLGLLDRAEKLPAGAPPPSSGGSTWSSHPAPAPNGPGLDLGVVLGAPKHTRMNLHSHK